ncbi:hypothetical protein [Halapricum desulfuricans]|nr:hypothetical protein [Halapricum desulfuricans]
MKGILIETKSVNATPAISVTGRFHRLTTTAVTALARRLPPGRATARCGSRSPASGATVSREWTFDRVVAAVVTDEHRYTASIAGQVTPKKRSEFEWSTSTGTQLTLISDFGGNVPSPTDHGYEALPDIVRARSDPGQQLLADLAADMQDRDDESPQLYTEFGKPIDDRETTLDLEERFGKAYWIITGVIWQQDYAFPDLEDKVTAIKACKHCGSTKHVYTGQD